MEQFCYWQNSFANIFCTCCVCVWWLGDTNFSWNTVWIDNNDVIQFNWLINSTVIWIFGPNHNYGNSRSNTLSSFDVIISLESSLKDGANASMWFEWKKMRFSGEKPSDIVFSGGIFWQMKQDHRYKKKTQTSNACCLCNYSKNSFVICF